MNKRIKKKIRKKVIHLMQEMNCLRIATGSVTIDNDLNVTSGYLWRVSGAPDIDSAAIKRFLKAQRKCRGTE